MNRQAQWMIPALVAAALLALPVASYADRGDQKQDRKDYRQNDRRHRHDNDRRSDSYRRYDPPYSSRRHYESSGGLVIAGKWGSVSIGTRIGDARHGHGVNCGCSSCVTTYRQGIWVPGHYEYRDTRVLVEPGHNIRRYVPPAYRTVYRYGCKVTELVRDGYYEHIWVPDRYEFTTTKVWVPGFWQTTHYGYRR